MVILRGQVWWADLGTPRGSSPGYVRPVVVVQANGFNKTGIKSVIIAIATTNQHLARMPGNVSVARGIAGLQDDSVINVTQLFTIDKTDLLEFMGLLPINKIELIDKGLRLVLFLPEN